MLTPFPTCAIFTLGDSVEKPEHGLFNSLGRTVQYWLFSGVIGIQTGASPFRSAGTIVPNAAWRATLLRSALSLVKSEPGFSAAIFCAPSLNRRIASRTEINGLRRERRLFESISEKTISSTHANLKPRAGFEFNHAGCACPCDQTDSSALSATSRTQSPP